MAKLSGKAKQRARRSMAAKRNARRHPRPALDVARWHGDRALSKLALMIGLQPEACEKEEGHA